MLSLLDSNEQLCWGNESLVELVTQKVLLYLRKDAASAA